MSLVFDTSLYMNGGAGGGSVDQTYDPTSPKAQSGTAVAQAIAGITIPTVNDATLTITQGGVSKGTFTANAGTDVTIALDSGASIDDTTITKNNSDELQASAVMNARTGTDALPIWQGTEQQWNSGAAKIWYAWGIHSYTANYTTTGTISVSNNIATIAHSSTAETNVLSKVISGNGSYTHPEVFVHLILTNNTITADDDNRALFSMYDSGSGPYIKLIAQNRNGSIRLRWNIRALDATESDYVSDVWTAANESYISDAVNNYNGNLYLKLYFDEDLNKYVSIKSVDGTTWSTKSESFISTASTWTFLNSSEFTFYNALSFDYSVDLLTTKAGSTGEGEYEWTPLTETYSNNVYTDILSPTTSSTVYSEPNAASALTITSVGTGTITLSDNNTYTYNQSGDEVTYQTIGEAHPTWLCNINGVGVKIGNTLIADNTDTSTMQTTTNLVTSISNASTDTEYPSAKCVYDIVGNIETALHNINSGS